MGMKIKKLLPILLLTSLFVREYYTSSKDMRHIFLYYYPPPPIENIILITTLAGSESNSLSFTMSENL